MIDVEHIRDPEQLRQVAVLLQRENERLHRRLKQLLAELASLKNEDAQGKLALEIQSLQEQMSALQRRIYGVSSERRPKEESHEDVPETPRRGHGPRAQAALPVIECTHELGEGERTCRQCGGQLEPFGDEVEQSEEITVIHRSFALVRHRRRKYRCRCQSAVVTAPAPPKIIEGGRYSLDFAVEVAVSKYADHLPLDRQRRIMAREGLTVETQTLWDQLEGLAQVLRRAYDALHRKVLDAPLLHADETWWRLWRSRPTKRWWVWTLASEEAVFHRVDPSRSGAVIRDLVSGYQGLVLTDGFQGYQGLTRDGPGIRLAHCWAHVRRKFAEIEPHYPQSAAEALDLIGKLYEVEAGLPNLASLDGDERDAALALRSEVRAARSRPLTEELLQWAFAQRGTPASGLRKAVDYMLTLWSGLTLFLDEPVVPLDNNHVERQLRGVVLGRKNHYGSRSRRGTEVAARFYSLIDTARLHGVDPRLYLREAALAGLKRPAVIVLPHELHGPGVTAHAENC
jgi:transposase